MADSHKNFAYSTVATAPSPASSGTSLVVAAGDGAKFPAVPFNATVWPTGVQPLTTNAEIVRVTNISTDTLTITRAQESSSARTIVVGDQIAATITAKTLTDAEQNFDATAPAAVGTAAAGSATTQAHRDHVHPTGAGIPSTQAFGDAAATGAGPAASMTDHKHAMMADPVAAHAAAADPHTGYVLESLFDAKGDLIAASADNTPAKVTVGADGLALIADSSQGAGVNYGMPTINLAADWFFAGG